MSTAKSIICLFFGHNLPKPIPSGEKGGLSRISCNRPFAGSGHMVQNHTSWDTSCKVDSRNKGRSRWTGTSSFVLKVLPYNLYPSMCDLLVMADLQVKPYKCILNLTRFYFTIIFISETYLHKWCFHFVDFLYRARLDLVC